jgi:uridylate kinase
MTSVPSPRYRRILLKLSGEALAGEGRTGLDAAVLRLVAHEVKDVMAQGVQVAIVVGGGNLVRGADLSARLGIDQVTAHYMGMLATVINALALQDIMEKEGLVTRVQTALEMHQIAEPYIRRRAIRHLEKGRVVIFAAGTGNPFFTTDTTAALRAVEIGAEVLLKASKVDGIYEADPSLDPDAARLPELTYMDFLARDLRVMDSTAVTMCKEHGVPIVVFDMTEPGTIVAAVTGSEPIGTVVR